MPRRGENIYKRKDGRWEARYVKEVTADGGKKYASVYAKSYAEVRAKQQQCLFRPTKAVCGAINLTVSVLISKWRESIKNQIKPNTRQKYESVCKNHIIGEIGSVPVKCISDYTVVRFANRLKEKGLSAKSINDVLAVLGLALKYAEAEYGTAAPKIRCLKEEKHEMRVLSFNEQLQLLAYLNRDADIFKFGVLLALYTGVRVGELCALRWEDITDEHIQIDKTMARVKTENGKTAITIGSPKSESSRRKIPTPQCLLPLIKRFQGSGYVLSNNTLNYTEPRLMQMKFEKMIAKCGLAKTNFHALRHTFATRCVEAGVDVKTLSELLGHADVKTTLNRYVHSSFELKQKGMAQLERSLIS